jgi:hypothetical protein
MKAIRVHEFGGPEVLKLEEVPAAKPSSGQVLVRIHAAGVNPYETYTRALRAGEEPAVCTDAPAEKTLHARPGCLHRFAQQGVQGAARCGAKHVESLNQKAIGPLGEAVRNTELFRRLARTMGFDDRQWQRSDEEMALDALDWASPRGSDGCWECALLESAAGGYPQHQRRRNIVGRLPRMGTIVA